MVRPDFDYLLELYFDGQVPTREQLNAAYAEAEQMLFGRSTACWELDYIARMLNI